MNHEQASEIGKHNDRYNMIVRFYTGKPEFCFSNFINYTEAINRTLESGVRSVAIIDRKCEPHVIYYDGIAVNHDKRIIPNINALMTFHEVK